MNKILTVSITLLFAAISATAQIYHEDDKEGLRVFLRQPSAEAGKINAEQLGLQISDTLDWQNDEEWVSKFEKLTWNEETPKRLTATGRYDSDYEPDDLFYGWDGSNLAGTLNASKWTKLQTLFCENNQLIALNLNANKKLMEIRCFDNLLTTLDVSGNTELSHLDCYGNQLVTLDLSANTKLTYLWCAYNQLTALNLSTNTELSHLACSYNQLTELDLSANMELKGLFCGNNQLTELNLSVNKKLEYLNCSNISLTTLDLSANTELWGLECENNQLTKLNLSANKNLKELVCSNNQLSTLDLSANTELQSLYCSNNQLSTLDLNANTKLVFVNCSNNNLSLSDLFTVSEVSKNNGVDIHRKFLGNQTLPPQTVKRGEKLDFPVPQNVFNDIYTEFTVTQNDNPAPESNYTVTNGEIKFKKSGIYTVKMTNKAIISHKEYPAEVILEVRVR